MKIPRAFALLAPCASAVEDESTLLSLHRGHMAMDAEHQSSQLLELASSRNVTKMSALMQNLVEESIRGDGIAQMDDDIRSALDIVRNTLLSQIRETLKTEHMQDQMDVLNQLKCFDSCRSARNVEEKKCNLHHREFEVLWSQHQSCRAELKGKYITKIKDCSSLDYWVENFELEDQPLEECVYDAQYICRNSLCKDGQCEPGIDQEFGAWLRRIIKQATAGYSVWQEKHETCKASYHAYIAVDSKCDTIEKQQEKANGQLRQCEFQACDVEYTNCRADCIKEYHETVKRVECAEKDRKIDWSATEKIECYIRILLNSPTDEELDKFCEGGDNCISKWRNNEYDKCNAVCVEVDFDTGSYSNHAFREGEDGEHLHIDDTSKEGKDGNPKKFHQSTQADIQHADTDTTEAGVNAGVPYPWLTDGVNTTHRGHGENRCTQHLDIDFQKIPCAIPCPPPRPCCDEKYKSDYESMFMSLTPVTEVSGIKKCHQPEMWGGEASGEHTERWAYNICECDLAHCKLVNTEDVAIHDDDYCPCHAGHAPKVHIEQTFKNVCVNAHAPATITFHDHFCVDRVHFVHTGGRVQCATGDHAADDNWSNWGCMNEGVALVMTKNGEKEVHLPTVDTTMGMHHNWHRSTHAHWYTMDGVTKYSQSMTWQMKEGLFDVKLQGSFQLWYNEDLFESTVEDNAGEACYNIVADGEWC